MIKEVLLNCFLVQLLQGQTYKLCLVRIKKREHLRFFASTLATMFYDGVWNQHVKKCHKSFLTLLRPWHANYFEVYIYSTQSLKRAPSPVLFEKKTPKELKIIIENASNFM